jgi:thiol-disulfide isomerase/thioredoxin
MENEGKWQMLYFTGPGCQVCRVLEPMVHDMIRKSFPQVEYRLVDVSEEMELAASHTVFTVPAIILLYESREYLREIRLISVPKLAEKIERLISLSE